MSWCAVINCNNKTKYNGEVSYFQLPKDTSVHKDWIHATDGPVDNLPSKIFIFSDILKRSALIPAGNFKMNCTIKTIK